MKMSDVFQLPLTPRKDANGEVVLSCNTMRRDLAASHAVNHFDELVEALDCVLTCWLEDCDPSELGPVVDKSLSILSRAKGE